MTKYIKRLFAATSLAALLCAPAMATNIVSNGGFESNGGWQTNFWGYISNDRGIHSGVQALVTGCTATDFSCTFSQSLSTVAGQHYNLSFWLYTDGIVDANGDTYAQFNNGLQVSFGGAVVSTLLDFPTTNKGNNLSPGGPSTLITVNDLLATSSTTVLQFAGYHGPAGIFVDDVAVEEAAATVPEPGTLALAGLALAAMFRARRQRQQR